MRGELSSGKFAKRHPLDWYCEEQWVTGQLCRALGWFAREKAEGLAIWDPAAGFGSTCAVIADEGFRCHLSDLVENVNWAEFGLHDGSGEATFFSADFLECEAAPAPCSVVCNPPYSYRKGIAEAFARHALKLVAESGGLRVCLLVPNKWLSSQERWHLFMEDHPPQAVLHLTQRPSMPPGDRIHLMGNRAFRGGMIDYCWIVWNVREPTAPGETRTVWLPPLGKADRLGPVEGLA
jgi:hypothetical protein